MQAGEGIRLGDGQRESLVSSRYKWLEIMRNRKHPFKFADCLYKNLSEILGIQCILLVFACISSQVVAQDVGDGYWGVTAGGHFTRNNEIDGRDIEFDTGFTISTQLGYVFNLVRAEVEIEYSESELDEGDSGGTDADLSTFRGSGGLYYYWHDILNWNALPYGGVGLGIARQRVRGDLDDAETALTAHGEAGIAFTSADSFDVVTSYRFEWYDSKPTGLDKNVAAHQIRLGVRFFY